MTPAAADEVVVPPAVEQADVATDPPPTEPAAEEAPPAEEPAAPVEEPAAPEEAAPLEEPVLEEAAVEETAPDALMAEADAPIMALALACTGWPVAGSPVANFEIDGNMCVDVAGRLDWANVGGQPRGNDGFDDATQFTQGAKESNWPWSAGQISGSGVAPAKTDIGNVYAYTQTVGGHVYAYLGFERAVNNGSVSYHVELNQLPNLTGPVPNRTVGDLRLTIDQTGSNLISLVGAERWDGDSWVSLGSLAGFVGQVNQGPIDNLSGAVLAAGTFAEVAVDLTVLFGNAGCSGNYGTLNVRSSSSPEDTSSLADWINPIALNVPSTCSTLTIRKVDPSGGPLSGATFSISPNPATGTGSTTGVTGANGTIVFSGNVQPGSYTITETVAPPGYLLDSTPQVVTFGAQAESKTVTFVDPLGSVSWLKHDGNGALLGGATFRITATGGAAASPPWDLDTSTITVVDNGVRDTDPTAGEIAVAGLPTGTYSVVETIAPAGYILDSTSRTFTVSQATPNPTIAAPFVNIPLATVTLTKVWVNSFAGDTAQIAISGAAAAQATSTAPTNGPVIQVTVAPGSQLSLAETLPDANTGEYSSTLTCVGASVTGNTGTGGSIVVPQWPASANGVQCTFTNTAVTRTVTLQKHWIDAIAGDTANLTAGTATATSTASGAADQLDIVNRAVATVRVGDTITLSEALGGTGSYGSSYSCTPGGSGDGTSFQLTVPNADVICTFENEARRATVTLKKAWVNAFAGDTAELEITGAESDSDTSTATEGNSVDEVNTAVVNVRLGQKVTLSEDLGDDNTGSYTASWACSNNTFGQGDSIPEITVTGSVTCTITNTAKTTDIVVNKLWLSAFEDDSAELSINGMTETSTATGVAMQLDENVVTRTVRVGESVTVEEDLGDNTGVYISTYSCAPVGGQAAGLSTTFTAPLADVECTFTNAAKRVDITLQKRWIDAIQGDTAELTAGDDTATSTASGASDQLDTTNTATVEVRVGDTVAMSEVVAGQGSYGSTYSCTLGDTTGDGTGRAFELTVPDGNVTCTFENEAQEATVTLKKAWVNAFLGDEALLEISGAQSDEATSIAPEGSGVDNANFAEVDVRVGDEVSMSEELGDENTGSYTSAWSCSNNTSGPGDSIPSFTVMGPVTCTITNTALTTDIVVNKVWVDAFLGDQADLSINTTGATSTANGTANQTHSSVVTLNVRVGSDVTVSESLQGDNRGQYTSTYVCGPVGGEGTGLSTSFIAPMADVECTFTNTAVKVGVLLQKRWLGGLVSDQARLSILREGAAELAATSVATGLFDELDNVNTVFAQVRIGELLTLAETMIGTGVYESKYICSTGQTSGDGNGRLFQLTVTHPSVCVFANRALTQSVSVVKTWVNGQEGDTADLSITGGAAETGQSTANGIVGEFTDVENMITADALIGEEVTVSELIGVEAGDPSDYTSSLVCLGADDTVLVDVDARTGSFTMPNQPVDCEFVNEAELPTIALEKVVAGAPVADTNWQLSATPEVGDVVTNPAGGDVDPTEVATGVVFELSEEIIGDVDGLDEFEPGEWSCMSDIDGEIELSDSEPGSAMLGGLDKGENVVCVIVNSHVDQGVEFEKTNTGSVQNEDGTWTVTYEIAVHNNSVLVPVPYNLSDTLTPTPGVTYLDADWSGPTTGSFNLPGSLTATLATGQMLAPYDGENDDVYTVVVLVEVTAAEPAQSPCLGSEGGIGIVNTAVLTIPGEEPEDSAACGTVHFDDVGIVKEAGRFDEEGNWVPFGAEDSVEPGESFQYVLTVTNHGTRDTVEPVVVTDPLHERLEVTDLELPAGWVNDNAPDLVDGDNVLSVSTPSMPAGAEVQIVLTVLFTEMVQEPVMWDHDGNPETPDVEVDLPPVIGDEEPPPAPEVLNSIINEACVETELDGDPSNDCSEVETPVREIVASVYTRCVADAPFLGWTVVKSETLLNEEIDMVWRPVNPDVTPETTPAQVEMTQPGGVLVWQEEIQWPGAEFTPSGVSIDYPGWRALAVTDYTADGQYIDPEDGLPMTPEEIGQKIFNGLILDASELDFAWRGNTEITFTVNPELTFSTGYPPATPQCFVARHTEVQIEKTASVAHTEPGGSFTYSMAVQNVSDDSAAEGVVVTDVIPADIKITDVSWPGEGDDLAFPNWETCAVAGQDAGGFGGTLTCELFGPLQPINSDNGGASAAPTITLAATVKSTATASVITNVGVVDYHTFGDPEDVGRDADDATVTLSALPATGDGTSWSLAILGLLALFTGSAALVVVRRRRGEQMPTL